MIYHRKVILCLYGSERQAKDELLAFVPDLESNAKTKYREKKY